MRARQALPALSAARACPEEPLLLRLTRRGAQMRRINCWLQGRLAAPEGFLLALPRTAEGTGTLPQCQLFGCVTSMTALIRAGGAAWEYTRRFRSGYMSPAAQHGMQMAFRLAMTPELPAAITGSGGSLPDRRCACIGRSRRLPTAATDQRHDPVIPI